MTDDIAVTHDRAQMDAALAAQRAAQLADPYPSADIRIDRLRRLEAVLVDNQRALCEAADADFAGRPHMQTRMEIFGTLETLRHSRKNVRAWMRPERRPLPLMLRLTGAKAQVLHQPLGVVGVVAPWNFPIVLSIGPLGGIFAAGNRAMLKPSELSPSISGVVKQLLARAFDAEELTTVLGGSETGSAFSSLPFDHLLFTGGPGVAKHVMAAAARNLVPVTLELGGKCPVVVGPEADWDLAVDRVMWGKIQNAGQICLAPDYLFVPRGREQAFVAAARKKIVAWYPRVSGNTDYCAIVNPRHFQRLSGYIAQARQLGCEVIELADNPAAGASGSERRMPPTLVLNPPDNALVMCEELFGPILSVKGYDSLDEVIAFVNARPRPLALYYFGSNRASIEALTRRTTSGGVTVNDIASHAAAETLPLGGIGNSGMGRYHGHDGFLNFSHPKAVLTQRTFSLAKFMNPPYTSTKVRMIDRLLGKRME